MSENQPIEPLPPKYYLDYFEFLLEFVQKLYGHILSDSEKELITKFEQLSEDARCLFVRFCNRRGGFFRTEKLHYPELDDIPAALYELENVGLIQALDLTHEPYVDEVLNLFTKEEWVKNAPKTDLSLRPLKKPDIIRFLSHTYTFSVLIDCIDETVVKVNYEVETMMFKFLFFGNRYADMTEFVIRDLGKVSFERYRDDAYTARFNTRREAEDKLMVSLMSELFYQLQAEALPPEEVYDWFVNWHASIPQLSEVAMPSFARLVNKVGLYLERQKLPEQALEVYQLTDLPPSRERRIRLLHKIGLADEAIALCQDLITHAQNADERFFAIDFQEKIKNSKKRVVKSITKFLNDAESITVPVDYRHRVEQGAVEHYIAQGFEAVHAENYVWRGLFGLIFWDIIYDANVQAIHHPLQRMPSDFYLPDFYNKRSHQIHQRLAALATNEDFEAQIRLHFTQKYGTANVLVDWSDLLLELVVVLCKKLTVNQLNAVLVEMSQNLREHTRGFSDLMIWNDNDFALIEIKSPTDHLSAQQLHWMHFMQGIGINAKVVRVKWAEGQIMDAHQ
jgi:VRR-NUC domain